MKMKQLPSTERLRELFHYDKITGHLVRAIDRVWVKKGRRVCCQNEFGHITVQVDGGKYLAHRLIWKIVTGNDPVDQIDHKDGDPTNNAWDNLREATRGQNNANSKLRLTNRSGVKGVWFVARVNRWRASVTMDKKTYNLGYFKSLDDAAVSVAQAREKFHGEFARAA
jgi:hypothetical protein